MKLNKNSGGTMVMMLMAITLMTTVSLYLAKLSDNIKKSQKSAQGINYENDLKSLIKMIINDRRFCKASLEGKTFNKMNIDGTDDSGLDVELWLSNQDGSERTIKKLDANDTSANKYGQLKIDSIKLFMNRGTANTKYEENPNHNDVGILKIVALEKVTDKVNKKIEYDFELNVEMSTNSSGLSTVLSCRPGEMPTSTIQGCSQTNKWYCFCRTENVGTRYLRITTCFHCDHNGSIDKVWLTDLYLAQYDAKQCSPEDSPPTGMPGGDGVVYYKIDEDP